MEENLFLAPGEGDSVEFDEAGNLSSTGGRGGVNSADALSVLKGEVR